MAEDSEKKQEGSEKSEKKVKTGKVAQKVATDTTILSNIVDIIKNLGGS